MLRLRIWRYSRIVFLLLLGWAFYYLLNNHELILPTTQPPSLHSKYATRATYEQTSTYRELANTTFEEALDAQLVSLSERALLQNPNLEAGSTIHQITPDDSISPYHAWVEQWRTNNPGWSHEMLTAYPKTLLDLYDSIPEIQATYNTYPALRLDLSKYLTLWARGGFYTDINTWERVSLTHCPPIIEASRRDVKLVIGVGRDEPFFSEEEIRSRGWGRGFGFETGTLWAMTRFNPILRTAIVRSISHALTRRKLAESGWMDSFQGRAVWKKEETGEIAGAGMFTDVVLETLSAGLHKRHELRDRDAGIARRVSWKKFRRLNRTLWIEPNQEGDEVGMSGIAVLPVNVWSNGQNHSSSGAQYHDDACVNRVFGGKPREKKWYTTFW